MNLSLISNFILFQQNVQRANEVLNQLETAGRETVVMWTVTKWLLPSSISLPYIGVGFIVSFGASLKEAH